MKSIFRIVFALIACLCLSLGSVVQAQSPEPPIPPSKAEYAFNQGRFETGSQIPGTEERRIVSDEFPIETYNSIQSTGGPDEFGYTWDDTVPLNWIDASTGLSVGTSGYVGYSSSYTYGPFDLPFSFKFYGNNYSQVHISQQGYLSFSDVDGTPREIPSVSWPDNLIAPLTGSHFYFDSNSWVKYTNGGTAPNRHFVVEWHDLRGGDPSDTVGGDEKFRFQAILHESGDITFQYGTMTYAKTWYCGGSSGIEDSNGIDGLRYLPTNCSQAPSNKAVLFTCPATSARVSVFPGQFGDFTGADQPAEIKIPIRNNGELGADVYDLELNSNWAGAIYDASGITLLTDTDEDALIDTGSVLQGETVMVTVKFQSPALAAVGDNQTAQLNVISSLNPSISKLVALKTAIPAPFIQLLRDFDNPDGSTLALIHPLKNKESGTYILEDPDYLIQEDPSAIVETPAGNFLYAWTTRDCSNIRCTYDIFIAMEDPYRTLLIYATPSKNPVNANDFIDDNYPALAVAPNGNIAVVWRRSTWDSTTGKRSIDLFMAILSSTGRFIKTPTNLTNEAYGITPPTTILEYQISATDDNRFQIAWSKETPTDPGSINDIYYMAFESNGALVRGLTKMTADTSSDSDGYGDPELTALQNNRSLLLWQSETSDDIRYSILDSAGNMISGPLNLTGDGSTLSDTNPSAVQLPNGKIFIAWNSDTTLRFALLNSSYQRIVGPTSLNPSGAEYDGPPSVTTDTNSRAIITWASRKYNGRLFYSLVDSSGTVLTQPMIFRSTSIGSSLYAGNVQMDNTTFSNQPAANVDTWVESDEPILAWPYKRAFFKLRYGNAGLEPTSSVVLQATMDANLSPTFSSDPPGSQTGNVYTWNLADLDWLDGGEIYIWLNPPNAAPGTQYPIEWTISSAGTEANPADNTFTSHIIIAYQTFLPLLRR